MDDSDDDDIHKNYIPLLQGNGGGPTLHDCPNGKVVLHWAMGIGESTVKPSRI